MTLHHSWHFFSFHSHSHNPFTVLLNFIQVQVLQHNIWQTNKNFP